MRKQLILIIPILGAMIGMVTIFGLNSVNAQNMSTPETNMTGMTNMTMDGNMTVEMQLVEIWLVQLT